MPCMLDHICTFTILRLRDSYLRLGSALNIHPKSDAFVIAAGAVLGICAGLLWTAQGSLMLSYPTEIQKGRFIGIFWSIFNLGGVVGAAVSFGLNFKSEVCQFLAPQCLNPSLDVDWRSFDRQTLSEMEHMYVTIK